MTEYQQAVSRLPRRVRLALYLIPVFAATVLTAVVVYFTTIEQPVPDAVKGWLAAIGVFSIGPGLVAASNVPKQDATTTATGTGIPAGELDDEPQG